jgi:hypothetical protein
MLKLPFRKRYGRKDVRKDRSDLRGGRRGKQLLDDKRTRGYCKLKEEALDVTAWRTRFGGGYGLVVRETTEEINIFRNLPLYIIISRPCRLKNDGENNLFLPPRYTLLIFTPFFLAYSFPTPCTVIWWYNHVHCKMAGISQSFNVKQGQVQGKTHAVKNSYSRVCIVCKSLVHKLTYADIRNVRYAFFSSHTSIWSGGLMIG